MNRSSIRARLVPIADGLAIAVIASLPWSNTAASFLIFLWLFATLPSLHPAEIQHELATFAGGMPLALFVFGFVGMAWANTPWPERLGGMDAFFKLATIPLLIAQFRRSERGQLAMMSYLISCAVLLVISFALMIWPTVE